MFVLTDEERMYAVSLWLVVDLQTMEGRSLAYAAVKRLVYTHTEYK